MRKIINLTGGLISSEMEAVGVVDLKECFQIEGLVSSDEPYCNSILDERTNIVIDYVRKEYSSGIILLNMERPISSFLYMGLIGIGFDVINTEELSTLIKFR